MPFFPPQCGTAFQEDDIIALNGTKEDVELLKKRMEERRLRAKLEKMGLGLQGRKAVSSRGLGLQGRKAVLSTGLDLQGRKAVLSTGLGLQGRKAVSSTGLDLQGRKGLQSFTCAF
ncbi:hypothetical protein U0070_000525 [Myodes glareolus]|uniref:Uncharacterized protein n=1 Tax=Myodes glareolus TaxID=447135 RepID=A0AAW0IIV3_MYOGA